MYMKDIKETPLTREDISNPFRKIPHKDLLKKAGVKKFKTIKVEHLPNGRIKVVEGNKEKFLKLVSNRPTTTLANIEHRIKNRDKIKGYQAIAIKVLSRMDELKLTKRDLALLVKTHNKQIDKVVIGKEAVSKDLLKRLEGVLNIKLLEI